MPGSVGRAAASAPGTAEAEHGARRRACASADPPEPRRSACAGLSLPSQRCDHTRDGWLTAWVRRGSRPLIARTGERVESGSRGAIARGDGSDPAASGRGVLKGAGSRRVSAAKAALPRRNQRVLSTPLSGVSGRSLACSPKRAVPSPHGPDVLGSRTQALRDRRSPTRVRSAEADTRSPSSRHPRATALPGGRPGSDSINP